MNDETTTVCKHCGAKLIKVTIWMHPNPYVPPIGGYTVSTQPLCIHEPAEDGEEPTGVPRTTVLFNE